MYQGHRQRPPKQEWVKTGREREEEEGEGTREGEAMVIERLRVENRERVLATQERAARKEFRKRAQIECLRMPWQSQSQKAK